MVGQYADPAVKLHIIILPESRRKLRMRPSRMIPSQGPKLLAAHTSKQQKTVKASADVLD